MKGKTMDRGRAHPLRRLAWISGLVTVATALMSGALLGQQTEREREGETEAVKAVEVSDRNAPVSLYVRNNNWLDARVYAVREGTRYRLGTVTSHVTEKFVLPRTVSGGVDGVQLLILPIGSNASYLTQSINVFPGDVLGLEVEEHLPLSSFFRAP